MTLLSDGERLTGAYALDRKPASGYRQATLAIRARVPLDVLLDTIPAVPDVPEIYLLALKALSARPLGQRGLNRRHAPQGHAGRSIDRISQRRAARKSRPPRRCRPAIRRS
jgi:hypothetical protein